MKIADHARVRILLPLMAIILSQVSVRTDVPPGSTVPFGQQLVGTSSAEIEVVKSDTSRDLSDPSIPSKSTYSATQTSSQVRAARARRVQHFSALTVL